MTAYRASNRLPRQYRRLIRRYRGGSLSIPAPAIVIALIVAAVAAFGGHEATTAHAPAAVATQPARTAAKQAAGDGAVEAIAFAKQQLGKWYLWGGVGPDRFDCSGLVMMAWRQAHVYIARTTFAQWASEKHIPESAVEPGDLVFFAGSDGSMTDPGHVAIVTNPPRHVIIEAYGTGYRIRYSTWNRSDLVGFTDPTART